MPTTQEDPWIEFLARIHRLSGRCSFYRRATRYERERKGSDWSLLGEFPSEQAAIAWARAGGPGNPGAPGDCQRIDHPEWIGATYMLTTERILEP